jgi:hypothetical protein
MADGPWQMAGAARTTGFAMCHVPSAIFSVSAYFVSLCPVCFLQYLQYLLISRRSDDFFRFFVVL